MVTQEIKQKVFISYSRKDIKFARRLAADLESAGFDVWWDISDLQGGDDWVRFIPAAIEASRFFVVLLSPDSIQSEWVSKEYSYALRLRKKIVPAMIRQCDVPFALNTINYVDFINAEYASAVNKLLVALGSEPLPELPVTGLKKFFKKIPLVITRNPFFSIGGIVVLFAILLLLIFNPLTPLTPPPTDTPTPTATITFTVTPRPTDLDTDTPTPSPTHTFTPTISATPSITPTKTPAPVNFVLPTVCIQPTQPNIQAVWVRSGPGTDRGVLLSAPAIEVGKCPLIGGHNEEDDWLMIAYGQSDPDYVRYEGGWVSKDLFDLSTPVFIPEITLTPTPTITLTPSITPTFTATLSPTPTPTYTNTPTPTFTPTRTFTPTATETPISTYTPSPTLEPEATNTP
jgi:hypothetical protein